MDCGDFVVGIGFVFIVGICGFDVVGVVGLGGWFGFFVLVVDVVC